MKAAVASVVDLLIAWLVSIRPFLSVELDGSEDSGDRYRRQSDQRIAIRSR